MKNEDLERQCQQDQRSSALEDLVHRVSKEPPENRRSVFTELYQQLVDKQGKFGLLFAQLLKPHEKDFLKLRLPDLVI